jgi:hypothetical protein
MYNTNNSSRRSGRNLEEARVRSQGIQKTNQELKRKR